MKITAAVLCFATLFSSAAFARVDWVGNIKLKTNRRGSNYEANVGSALKLNVCDYGISVIEARSL